MLTVSADQHTLILMNGLQTMENAVLCSHRTGQLRKRLLELDG